MVSFFSTNRDTASRVIRDTGLSLFSLSSVVRTENLQAEHTDELLLSHHSGGCLEEIRQLKKWANSKTQAGLTSFAPTALERPEEEKRWEKREQKPTEQMSLLILGLYARTLLQIDRG